jgi:hypothetical protein
VGDKGNDRVKFPSIRALSRRNERLKTNEEAKSNIKNSRSIRDPLEGEMVR